jgi:hypothetical protein
VPEHYQFDLPTEKILDTTALINDRWSDVLEIRFQTEVWGIRGYELVGKGREMTEIMLGHQESEK